MPMLTSGRSRFIGGSRVPPAPVPVAGAELLTNGDFSAGDTGWNVGAGWSITDIASKSAGVLSNLFQSATAHHQWCVFSYELLSVSAGYAFSRIGDTFSGYHNTLGSHLITANSYASATLGILGTADFVGTVDNASGRNLTLASLISTRPYASADIDISVAVTRTAGTQAGISARVDSAATPANFLIAYLDGGGNVMVDKCIAGTYTNVITGAVTYADGRILRLVCSGNNVSAYYNGTQVGTTQTVSDGAINGNKNHGLFSTYAANTFTGYTAIIADPVPTMPAWAMAGGAPSPIAAYQPKGAASLAASYINLANPGTYDAAPGVAPTLAAGGWQGNGSSTYLQAGIIPTATYTMLVQFSGTPKNGSYLAGSYKTTPTTIFGIGPNIAGNRWFWNGSYSTVSGVLSAGNMAIAGSTAYSDGVSNGAIPSPADTGLAIYLLALNTDGSPTEHSDGIISAVAIYDSTLTAGQVAAISAAMAAL